MKKGFLLIAIVLWALIGIIVAAVILFGVNGGFNNMTKTGTLIKNEDVLLGSIQNIVVEGSNQTVEIRKTSGDSVRVSQYGNAMTKSEKLFLVSNSEGSVRIYFNNTWSFTFFNFNINERLVVEIPEDFTGNLDAKTSSGSIKTEDELTLKNALLQSSSGGIYINKNLAADTLKVKTSSGGVHIEGNLMMNQNIIVRSSSGGIKFNGTVTAKELDAETSSGSIRSTMDIKADERVFLRSSSGGINLDGAVTAKDLNAKTNSGGIGLGNVSVETYYLQSSSGKIKTGSISGGGEAETSSGGIQLSLKNPKGNIKLSSSSGGINIALEPSLQFTLDAQTSSGGIHTNFAAEKNEKGNKATAKIGDSPTVNIFASASSGGIRIER
ncbi:MAG: hypothetical protein K0R90_247 [Oscillospiraceae bacterium]|nr:hypothetical protein [Oscillospiraceae bacterium]